MGWRDWTAVGLLLGLLAVKAVLVLGSDDDADRAAGRPDSGEEIAATVSLVETMGGADTVGYARAFAPRPFAFPADHGPHPDFRTEWWYLTSNLESADGRRFGFQFTIFRSALAPPGASGEGAAPGAVRTPDVADEGSQSQAETALASGAGWTTRQMYLGHFTLTDVEAGRFTEFERFTRGAAGLAGAWAGGGSADSPLVRVWLDDWQLASTGAPTRTAEGTPATVGPDAPLGADPSWPLRLTAADSGVAIDVTLEPLKSVVLQGDRGLSQKGPEAGNASYYYSYPRLAAVGTVTVDGEAVPVSGLAWMDREWSTSALGAGQEGWDWFSLQLSDGSELMVYQIRESGGAPSPESEGVWIAPDGGVTRLAARDYTLTPTDRWSSPVDGADYPSGWRIEIPRLELELEVDPVVRDQELNVTFRYWEGAVDVAGFRAGAEIAGRGYVELTGYAEQTGGSTP